MWLQRGKVIMVNHIQSVFTSYKNNRTLTRMVFAWTSKVIQQKGNNMALIFINAHIAAKQWTIIEPQCWNQTSTQKTHHYPTPTSPWICQTNKTNTNAQFSICSPQWLWGKKRKIGEKEELMYTNVDRRRANRVVSMVTSSPQLDDVMGR